MKITLAYTCSTDPIHWQPQLGGPNLKTQPNIWLCFTGGQREGATIVPSGGFSLRRIQVGHSGWNISEKMSSWCVFYNNLTFLKSGLIAVSS